MFFSLYRSHNPRRVLVCVLRSLFFPVTIYAQGPQVRRAGHAGMAYYLLRRTE